MTVLNFNKNIYLSLCIALVLFSIGCKNSSESKTESTGVNKEIDKKISAILKEMTLEDKVGQMTQITLDVITKGKDIYVSDEPVELDKKLLEEAIIKYRVGSILNTANNRARSVKKWNELIKEIQDLSMEELGVPLIYGIDAIHGATYTAEATMFPQQIGIAATWNPELAKKGAEITAYETRKSSIPWNFSPVLDMGRNPLWPRIWETYGEDPYLTSVMGEATIKGYEGADNDVSNPNKVASCIKHFIAYGAERSGKDRTPTYIPEIELREYYLPSYKTAIDAGAQTIMINSGTINGVPVHANYQLLTELLREELGFDGVVVTDWADIDNIYKRDKVAEGVKEATLMAINAGIDMAMVPYHYDFTTSLVELVKEGEISEERIDKSVKRILKLKLKLGLFEKPYPTIEEGFQLSTEEAKKEAYLAASESITLLKNEKAILPLKKGAKILVTGPNANSMRTLNGGWSYSWQGEKTSEFTEDFNTIVEAVKNEFGANKVKYVPSIEYNMEGKFWEENIISMDKAVAAAKNSDYILLCLGENSYTETVGNMNDLQLSKNQLKLAHKLSKTGKPIILVLNEGRPRLIKSIESLASGIIQTYLPGNFGSDALASILSGEVNPSGKLPYTYPMYPNALITYDYKPSQASETMEGAYDYDSTTPVQYNFGFGLSYTTFEYSNLKLSKSEINPEEEITVSVEVKNSGNRSGKEVVQLYSRDLIASVTPDNRRLRKFKKINLESGETKTVNFSLSGHDLAFVGVDMKMIVEKGDFKIMIEKLSESLKVLKTSNLK